MALTVSDKQLKALEIERCPVVVVRHGRTKKGYAVMPEHVYKKARPLIEFVLAEVPVPRSRAAETWTGDKNARRAALINKKYETELSAAETQELAELQEEVCRYQEHVAPLQNHALKLILEALERRAKETDVRKP